MQRKIAAILAADVAGYSRLVAADEDDTLKRLLSCREVFADLIGKAGGRIFNTAGDAVLAECPSAIGALQAAIDIQESLRTLNRDVPVERHMLFRIGITIGDVFEREGDLLGDGVNVAARLESLAIPGGICISRNMYEQVGNKIDVRFQDIGPQVVKNLPTPIHAFLLTAGQPNPLDVPDRPAVSFRLVGIVSTLLIVAVTIAFVAFGLRMAHPAAERYYGFVAPPGVMAQPSDVPFDADRIPFVCASCRAEIAAAVSEGTNSAVALSDTGAYGYAAELPTVDEARAAAMRSCADHRRGNGVCQVYAVDGVVVWPRALPMPPHPWVNPTVNSEPFDATRIGGPWAERFGATMNKNYSMAENHKAVALDDDGHWYWRGRMETEQEAVRSVLELCSNRAGSMCRIIALDGAFVVPPSGGPVTP